MLYKDIDTNEMITSEQLEQYFSSSPELQEEYETLENYITSCHWMSGGSLKEIK